MKYTLHFIDENTGLQVTLQADSFDKIVNAISDYKPKGIEKVEGKPNKVLTKN